MQLLIYGNRKQDDMIWDISTPLKRQSAFLRLFNYLRTEWQVYDFDELPTKQKEWYNAALLDSHIDAEKLLTARRKYEYEEWRIVEAIDPLEGE